MPNVLAFVDALQRANSETVAFYPKVALERGLESQLLSFAYENGDLAGYMYRSRPRPSADLKIWQAVIDYDVRRRHLGEAMVEDYLAEARLAGANSVTLRCRSSIEANDFWRALDFICVGVEPGGKRRGADINLWRYGLEDSLALVPPTGAPSNKKNDRSEYLALRKSGFEFPSAFSRSRGQT